jgi:uncharacterized protein YdaU (DUF1376 family)
MNYYEHHLGDWAAATGHLTWDEDMAYTRLLRAYYHAEKAIPVGQQYRLAKAVTPAQRKAVDSVLAEFFLLEDDGYHQKRADEEIARFQEKAPDRQAKKDNAKERQRRARERRKYLFELLRKHGVVPAYEATTAELEAQLSRVTSQPVTRDVTQPVTRDDTATQHQAPDPSINTGKACASSTGVGTQLEDENLASEGESDEPPEPPEPAFVPTPAGAVCLALKRAGIGAVSPSNQRLLMLLEAGATVDEFTGFAAKAIAQGGSGAFQYVLAAVEGERLRAKQTLAQLHQGPLPSAETTYQRAARERVEEASGGMLARRSPTQHPEFVNVASITLD